MEIYGLVGLIVVIGVVCALLEVPEKFQRLLYILGAVLVIVVVLSLFGIDFGGHLRVR